MKILKLACAFALVTGCAFKPSNESKIQILSTKGLEIEVLSRDEAYSYAVRLNWRGLGLNGRDLTLRRLDDKGREYNLGNVSGAEGTFTDEDAVAGVTYKYSLLDLSGKNVERLAEGDLVLPKDLVLDTKSKIPESVQEYGRVFLTEGEHVVQGSNLNWKLNEIHAKNAVLIIGPESATAKALEVGANPKTFRLEAERAFGNLKIISRGQHGGAGAQGETGAAGGRGSNGRDSKTRKEYVGIRGVTGREIASVSGPSVTVCESEAEDGSSGKEGNQGGRGKDGLRGGDSPSMFIKINDSTNFEIKTEVEPGHGGSGGLGGDGGNGGPGGKPGFKSDYCRRTPKVGPRGRQGLRGPSGNDGGNGSARAICMILGGTQIGECSAFTGEGVQ